MMQSILVLIMGVAVLLCIALLAAARAKREKKGEHSGKRIREPVARWLDTHPVRDWMRHKH
ncbi:hypothetical protein BZM27_39730 [Paraburkholderia steynii]|uniref:Uncharacterized protein n=1 Tax=Paraburkholderia steynii TaxID=1245441 RepID=A0A4R0XCQ2_9BURK|nr:hypothetical protein BZM27_39730 [Paraburkholderia steynii]